MQESQLTLNFDRTIVSAYASCREYVQTRVHQQSKQVQLIAADMDYSPSDLSRKLAQSPNDSRRFTLDDLESYVEKTNDKEPIIYLAAKYLYEDDETALRRHIAELQSRLDSK
ncbi:MAG: hypothetical protein COB36_10930 [Alphaproteobacteria bacterium]|nr:MAG: hypothetical protein COB36_10930 [Alphaproteobacteria bacterium]